MSFHLIPIITAWTGAIKLSREFLRPFLIYRERLSKRRRYMSGIKKIVCKFQWVRWNLTSHRHYLVAFRKIWFEKWSCKTAIAMYFCTFIHWPRRQRSVCLWRYLTCNMQMFLLYSWSTCNWFTFIQRMSLCLTAATIVLGYCLQIIPMWLPVVMHGGKAYPLCHVMTLWLHSQEGATWGQHYLIIHAIFARNCFVFLSWTNLGLWHRFKFTQM